MKIFKGIIVAVSMAIITGCSSHAIVPLRMTYTYPVAEPCQYGVHAACGAIAFWNDKLLELYLPYQQQTFDKAPARYEFIPNDEHNDTWKGKRENTRGTQDIQAHFILTEDVVTNPAGFRESRGMLVVVFPDEKAKYGDLAGKTIWLTPSVGWENVKQLKGVFWESESQLPESIGIRFSKD